MTTRSGSSSSRKVVEVAAADDTVTTASNVLAENNLSIAKTEPKGSCWLMAILGCIQQCVSNSNNPTARDRLLDWHVRRSAIDSIFLWVLNLDHRMDAIGTSDAQHLCELIEKAHLIPFRTIRRKGGLIGNWAPARGWAGSDIFPFVSGCACLKRGHVWR